MKFLDSIPWWLVVIACLSIGLAPFTPEPHVWAKLKMLTSGELTSGVDIFDFALHGSPWVLLILKLVRR